VFDGGVQGLETDLDEGANGNVEFKFHTILSNEAKGGERDLKHTGKINFESVNEITKFEISGRKPERV